MGCNKMTTNQLIAKRCPSHSTLPLKWEEVSFDQEHIIGISREEKKCHLMKSTSLAYAGLTNTTMGSSQQHIREPHVRYQKKPFCLFVHTSQHAPSILLTPDIQAWFNVPCTYQNRIMAKRKSLDERKRGIMTW